MNKAAELLNIIPFKEDKTWYLALSYKYEDEKGKHILEIPKTTLPFPQGLLPRISCDSFYFKDLFISCNDSMPLYKSTCPLASNRGIKDPACVFDIIIEPTFRKMTLDEIEKELGYKVKIISNDEKK